MTDIVIIGGGIIGLLTAREFSKAGASVTLVEKGRLGQEASWAGGGILVPLYPWQQPQALASLCLWGIREYPKLANSLAESSGIDPEWTQSGLLIADNPHIDPATAWCETHAINHEQPTATQIRHLIPNGQLKTLHPIWLPNIAQIRNPRLLKALHSDLLRRGIKILEHHSVIELDEKHNRIQSIKTNRRNLTADYVVLTTGAWTENLSKTRIPELHVRPVKGQIILYKTEPTLLRPMILHKGYYVIPRRDGHLLVGSTLEHTGFDKSTTQEARTALEQFATSLLPALKKHPIKSQWAGLRPGTKSGIPYIDIHPEIQNLSVNCGHFRNGIVMAPASARLLVDLILKRETVLPPEPYALNAQR